MKFKWNSFPIVWDDIKEQAEELQGHDNLSRPFTRAPLSLRENKVRKTRKKTSIQDRKQFYDSTVLCVFLLSSTCSSDFQISSISIFYNVKTWIFFLRYPWRKMNFTSMFHRRDRRGDWDWNVYASQVEYNFFNMTRINFHSVCSSPTLWGARKSLWKLNFPWKLL